MRLLIVALITMLLASATSAQEMINLTGSWVDVEADLKWNDRIDMKLTQSSRFDDILGNFNTSNTTFKLAYHFNDWLKVVGGYRYMYRSNNSRKFNRYQLALQARKKIEKIKLTWRTRFEYREAINRDRNVSRLRNRFTISYDIKSLDIEPRVFCEYWYSFDEPLQDFSKYRLGIGIAKSISKRSEINLGFNYDGDLNQSEIERESIFRIGYTYNFKRKKATKIS